jgi:dipeptidyl aminopeptidase/acylaminoacyl peptidase
VTPPEIWIKDEGGMRRVTDMNKDLLTKLRVTEPEEFHLTTSEGVKVQGWVIKPRDFREGEKYPTILEIHGGPHGMFGYELSGLEHEFQVLANNGYAVIYSNPRASLGQGEAFAAAVYGCWGEYDGRDLMEVVDYAIKTYPFMDPERLGVTGLSYGGYMTNWLIGHTDRFKAAVSRNSLTNMYSGWGTSDIGWMGWQISRAKNPWDNLQFFMEQSPIHYIEKIETPLLLIHCEDDIRCPIEQSEQLFTGLKKLKRKVEFVRFPGESHVMINIGTPKHRVERLQHVVRWFDRYLK